MPKRKITWPPPTRTTNTHPRTTQQTHSPTKPSTNQPNHRPCVTTVPQQHIQQRTKFDSSYSNFAIRWFVLEFRQSRPVQRRKKNRPRKGTGRPPTGTKALTHVRNDPGPPTPPPTDQPVHPLNTPTTMCYDSSTAVRTAANRCVWSVRNFYLEIIVGCGQISEDYPATCRCAVWYCCCFV